MAKDMKIPFSPPDISELEVQEVAQALLSGWITTGPRTKELERKVAQFCGTERAVCLNSATAALELTLHVLGISTTDEVITSAYTYTASASPVVHIGAQLVLVDTQEGSYEMDYDALEAAITEKTKVIIPVDIGGVPCDYKRILEIVERKKSLFTPENDIQRAIGRVIVVADSAHGFGSSYGGVMSGALADFTTFSFHAVKNFTTAEGGAVTWKTILGVDNEAIYKEYQLLSLHGQNKDALAKTQLGAWEYDIKGCYYKCNLTDVAAAIGLMQFDRYPSLLARRKEIVELYSAGLKDLPVQILTHYTEDYTSSAHLYLVRFLNYNLEQRNALIEKLAEVGVATNVHYKPLPMHTAYKNLGFDIKDYPNAYKQFENEISLPLHTKLTNEEIAYIVDMIKQLM